MKLGLLESLDDPGVTLTVMAKKRRSRSLLTARPTIDAGVWMRRERRGRRHTAVTLRPSTVTSCHVTSLMA